jgi:hypothetical protein
MSLRWIEWTCKFLVYVFFKKKNERKGLDRVVPRELMVGIIKQKLKKKLLYSFSLWSPTTTRSAAEFFKKKKKTDDPYFFFRFSICRQCVMTYVLHLINSGDPTPIKISRRYLRRPWPSKNLISHWIPGTLTRFGISL